MVVVVGIVEVVVAGWTSVVIGVVEGAEVTGVVDVPVDAGWELPEVAHPAASTAKSRSDGNRRVFRTTMSLPPMSTKVPPCIDGPQLR
jgi:hypothetical protein